MGEPETQAFEATLLATGGNNVGLPVPDDVLTSLGRGRRVPVEVTVDDAYTFRTTTGSMAGQVLISFNAATRAATGRGAGDVVAVRVRVDDAPRAVEPPADLAARLTDDPAAAAAWAALTPSRQKAHATSLEGARTDATRTRRLQAVLDALGGGSAG